GEATGKLVAANGGTLFLDEIAACPPAIQAKLLRVIEEKELTPLGSTTPVKLDLRIVAASNEEAEQAVREGRLRQDLLFRLNTVVLSLPPLRARRDDISLLFTHFLGQYAQVYEVALPDLSHDDMAALLAHDWPGNVRELRNLAERSVILGGFPEEFAGAGSVTGAQAIEDLDLVVQRHILHMLDLCDGNRAEAARRLGVSRKTIDRKIAQWDQDELSPP
uniref:sigma 54-interacting transcriptional regulator n=1 Tax=Salipiger bermudensis TaxID=344736 RepID=UPI00351555DF